MDRTEEAIAEHYGRDGAFFTKIVDALRASGLDPDNLAADALSGVEEFHLGGRTASVAVAKALGLGPASQVLDVGSGIGGPARTLAQEFGCRVVGVDLTPEFVSAATELSQMVGLGEQTTFTVGSATNLDFPDGRFDAVTLFHVGMNLPDKPAVLRELARVLRSGGAVAIYDLMRIGDGELSYPVPWARTSASSFVGTPQEYTDAISRAGLQLDHSTDRTALAMEFVAALAEAPPIVNLSHLVGDDFPVMLGNVIGALRKSALAPIEMLARKP